MVGTEGFETSTPKTIVIHIINLQNKTQVYGCFLAVKTKPTKILPAPSSLNVLKN